MIVYKDRSAVLKFNGGISILQIAKEILGKNKKMGVFSSLNFKQYYKAVVIRTVWYWNKNRLSDQQ